jgi:hypothetical protein
MAPDEGFIEGASDPIRRKGPLEPLPSIGFGGTHPHPAGFAGHPRV